MGGKISKGLCSRGSSSLFRHSSRHVHPQLPYVPHGQNYAPQQNQAGGPHTKLEEKYSRIADNYNSLEQVTEVLAQAGLESSNLIIGIDFTKSNEWTGSRSFNQRSLHHIGLAQNPYEQVMSIIGRILSAFDEDNSIPCFGFGDASTNDQDIFSFYPDERPCSGFMEALMRYREILPHLQLAGWPTSFAPIIEMATTIVEQSGGQYHVLLIIADGQVTRSVDTERGQLSPQEEATVEAIVKASEYPLSIILVGVGDGPWDRLSKFVDNIPARAFDNFQFVNFTDIMSQDMPVSRKEAEFSLAALMEIPSQYRVILELNLRSSWNRIALERVPLPPPLYDAGSFSLTPTRSNTFQRNAHCGSSELDEKECPICLNNQKDMAFACGHQTCCDCGQVLQLCPICRSPIQTRIRLY
ncbi:zinc finger protein [Macleaya cordata]|uniref:Zinc finger protein n=1 Tax=Macleaya cordata TaxID=56857 RepID=A0A200QCY5_MACCD|nr:zinc finger protein [Macleaya cordata]